MAAPPPQGHCGPTPQGAPPPPLSSHLRPAPRVSVGSRAHLSTRDSWRAAPSQACHSAPPPSARSHGRPPSRLAHCWRHGGRSPPSPRPPFPGTAGQLGRCARTKAHGRPAAPAPLTSHVLWAPCSLSPCPQLCTRGAWVTSPRSLLSGLSSATHSWGPKGLFSSFLDQLAKPYVQAPPPAHSRACLSHLSHLGPTPSPHVSFEGSPSRGALHSRPLLSSWELGLGSQAQPPPPSPVAERSQRLAGRASPPVAAGPSHDPLSSCPGLCPPAPACRGPARPSAPLPLGCSLHGFRVPPAPLMWPGPPRLDCLQQHVFPCGTRTG